MTGKNGWGNEATTIAIFSLPGNVLNDLEKPSEQETSNVVNDIKLKNISKTLELPLLNNENANDVRGHDIPTHTPTVYLSNVSNACLNGLKQEMLRVDSVNQLSFCELVIESRPCERLKQEELKIDTDSDNGSSLGVKISCNLEKYKTSIKIGFDTVEANVQELTKKLLCNAPRVLVKGKELLFGSIELNKLLHPLKHKTEVQAKHADTELTSDVLFSSSQQQPAVSQRTRQVRLAMRRRAEERYRTMIPPDDSSDESML